MRKIIVISIFLFLALALVACGNNGGGASDIPEGAETGGIATPIPSPTPTPWPTLPPTNVPQAYQHQGHIYLDGASTVHTVQEGETLGQIANFYEVPLDLIANANRIYDTDSIEVGEILYIPPCE